MLADQVGYVVGVDTHRDENMLAVVAAPAGEVVAQRRFARVHVVMRRRCVSPRRTRLVRGSGRSRVQATTVPGLPAI